MTGAIECMSAEALWVNLFNICTERDIFKHKGKYFAVVITVLLCILELAIQSSNGMDMISCTCMRRPEACLKCTRNFSQQLRTWISVRTGMYTCSQLHAQLQIKLPYNWELLMSILINPHSPSLGWKDPATYVHVHHAGNHVHWMMHCQRPSLDVNA